MLQTLLLTEEAQSRSRNRYNKAVDEILPISFFAFSLFGLCLSLLEESLYVGALIEALSPDH